MFCLPIVILYINIVKLILYLKSGRILKKEKSDDTSTSSEDISDKTNTNIDEDLEEKDNDSDEIIGDSVTGKYHKPGQARYCINEDRAVYFKSEKDAQNQGYVKSKR